MYRRAGNRISFLVVTACAIALSGCKTENIVSTSQEVEIGRQASAQVEAQYPVDQNASRNRLVNDAGREILRHVTVKPGITYTFKVLDMKEVNAFSLPGGWIYVQRGLIDATSGNVSQLAGVIAHEIAHVQARHAAQMIGRQEIYGTAIGALTKGTTAEIASVVADLNQLHFSRKDEYEADRLAVDYLLPSKYDPQGLIDFFKVLLTQEGKGQTPSWLRTHPITQNRIDRLQAYLKEKGAQSGR